MITQSPQVFFDTNDVSLLSLMKQKEDFVPTEFVTNPRMKSHTDTSAIYYNLREKYFSTEIREQGSMREYFAEKKSNTNYYPSLIIFVVAALVVIAKTTYWRSFRQLYESLSSMIKLRLWLRDIGGLLGNLFIFTTPAFLLISALSLDIFVENYSGRHYDFSMIRYLIYLTGIVMLFLTRYFLMQAAAWVFSSQQSTNEQFRIIQLHNVLFLFLMLVVLPFALYIPNYNLYYAIAVLFVVNEGTRVVKGLISAISLKEYSGYYFFLYFCTVEILPVIFILKAGLLLAGNNINME